MPEGGDVWEVIVGSWIIQDGNYGDFSAGEEAEFALEFWALEGTAFHPSPRPIGAALTGAAEYDVVSSLVFQTPEITVVDFGVQAYRETRLGMVPREARTTGRVAIGIDPFFYFEQLCKIPGVPPLIYSWRIHQILRQTAPFIEQPMEGGVLRVRDPQRLGHAEVQQTDAWNDDGGYGEYILRVELLEDPPRHRFQRGGRN